MTTPHTPEPWYVERRRENRKWTITGPLQGLAGRWCIGEGISNHDVDTANAERIVACVNACEGLADPAASLSALREALRAALNGVYWSNGNKTACWCESCNQIRAALQMSEPVEPKS